MKRGGEGGKLGDERRRRRRRRRGEPYPPGVPVQESALNKRMRVIGRAVKAGTDEVAGNVRARSAIMRVAEKTG